MYNNKSSFGRMENIENIKKNFIS